MPLDLKFNVHTTDDCKNLVLTENSGEYNSEHNPTGWGGPNISADNLTLSWFIQPFMKVKVNDAGDTKIISPFLYFTSEQELYTNFITPGSVKSLKLSISFDNLYLALYDALAEGFVSLGLENGEWQYIVDNTSSWESIMDGVYITTVSIQEHPGVEFSTQFNNICNIQNKISDMLTNIDLRCEDCDDQDIKDVSFYNALLQNLKNV